MKMHRQVCLLVSHYARTGHRWRARLCRPLPATPSITRPERRATAEGKIDLGVPRRGEMPVCTRFGAAHTGESWCRDFASRHANAGLAACRLRVNAMKRDAVRKPKPRRTRFNRQYQSGAWHHLPTQSCSSYAVMRSIGFSTLVIEVMMGMSPTARPGRNHVHEPELQSPGPPRRGGPTRLFLPAHRSSQNHGLSTRTT